MDFLNSINPIAGLIDSVGDAIDKNVTSDEERLAIKKDIMAIQANVTNEMVKLEFEKVELEKIRLEHQRALFLAESKSDNILQSSTRPITMLTILGLLVSHWLGYSPPNLSEQTISSFIEIISIYTYVYAGGRTIEKTAKTIPFNWNKKDIKIKEL